MWNQFTDQAKQAVWSAQDTAAGGGHALIEPAHLFLGTFQSPETIASQTLTVLGIDREALLAAFPEPAVGEPTRSDGMQFSDPTKQAIDRAYAETRQAGDEQIHTGYLLLGALGDPGVTARLAALGSTLTLAAARVACLRLEPSPPEATTAEAKQTWSWASHPSMAISLALLVMLWLGYLAAQDVLVAAGSLDPMTLITDRGWISAGGWGPGIAASVWTVATVPFLCFFLKFRTPSRWAAVAAFLFCKSASGLAWAAFFSFGPGVWSPGAPSVSPAAWVLRITFWVVLSTISLFAARDRFGVGARDGWSTLWKKGGWMLASTVIAELIQLLSVFSLVHVISP